MTTVKDDGVVEFRFYRPDGSSVGVAGDFNGWKGESMPMHRDQEGWWTATAKLPAGEYRFRYNVDGRWFTDFASHGVELSPMGYNAVLVIPRNRIHAGERNLERKAG